MASSSGRRSGSSARSTKRKRVVIGPGGVDSTAHKHKRKANIETSRTPTTAAKGPSKQRSGSGVSRTSGVAKSKREQRERRRAQQRRWLRLKYILGAAILLSAVYGVVRVYQSPFLTVNEVTVEGTSALDAEHVRAVSGITGSDTLLRLNPNEVEERLIDDPWILEAEVRRSLPGVVRISIVERVPVAVIDSGPDGYWLIDSAAVLLARQAVDETMTVPVVRDVALTEYVAGDLVDDEVVLNVLAVIDGLSPEMRSITRAISAPAIDRTALITQNDVEIFIGTADDLEMKDMLARRILDEQGAGVVSINVRSTDRPTWRGLDSTQ